MPAGRLRFEPQSPAMPACRQPPSLVTGGVARAVVTDRSDVSSSRTVPQLGRLGPLRRPAVTASRTAGRPSSRRPSVSDRLVVPASRLARRIERSAVTIRPAGPAARGDWDSPGPSRGGHRPDPAAGQCRGGRGRWASFGVPVGCRRPVGVGVPGRRRAALGRSQPADRKSS